MWDGEILIDEKTCFLLFILPLSSEKPSTSIVNQYYENIFAKAGMLGFINCFQVQDVALKNIRDITKVYFRKMTFQLEMYITFASRWLERNERAEKNTENSYNKTILIIAIK